MNNEEKILSWLEDEESRFIFCKRMEYLSVKPNFKPIREMVDRCCPELSLLENYPDKMKEFLSLVSGMNVYIWGAGVRCAKIAKMAETGDFNIIGTIDINAEKLNSSGNLDVVLYAPDDVDLTTADRLVVSIENMSAVDSVCIYAKEHGLKDEDIIIFNDYHESMHLLDKQYFDEIIKFEEGEVFVDAGVLDLSTTLRFAQKCREQNISDFRSIAFEPDKESYSKCKEIRAQHGDLDIELVNSGLYSSNTTIGFNSLGNGNSSIMEEGGSASSIDVVTLDSYIEDRRVTYIKMDIEGAELEALKGCAETIRKQKPKLAISIYHKPEDMTEIPLFIKSLVPEYKFYIRHYSDSPAETILYALP
ncbi:MAG: FkbM family methyltransferase [Oscillospiraceae bacterium]|nr:FkbM family methyltransferase [Oscillospiraceae bacterium]